MSNIEEKIKRVFSDIVIFKSEDNDSVFKGRKLPSFVKDYLIQKHIDSDGKLNKDSIITFLEKHVPVSSEVKHRLYKEGTIRLLTNFITETDIKGGKICFEIPNAGIKFNETEIPHYVVEKYGNDFVDGEKWGVIELELIPKEDRKGRKEGYVVNLTQYKSFHPYKVDLQYFLDCRKQFTTEEWIDVLLSAIEYNPDGFSKSSQKLELLTRLLIFVEPQLNMIELAPKGTGKSTVFGNLSKYGWLISGGRISRAKLFYDKTRRQPGIMKNHDFVTFDEIKTISFQDPSEMKGILKSYLESGEATVDNYKFLSDCGAMLAGNIDITDNRPRHGEYFTQLPENFRESALLDRFHGFIEGWLLPRLDARMILQNAWALNLEYFSEALHLLRTSHEYSSLVDKIIDYEKKSDLRDLKAIRRITTAYSKLLFPHVTSVEELNKDEFENYCLEPAIRRREIIKEQCRKMDEEFKGYAMPKIWLKNEF